MAKKQRKESIQKSLQTDHDHVKLNKSISLRLIEDNKNKILIRVAKAKEAQERAADTRKANLFRKEVKCYLRLNAQEIKAM